MTLAEIEKLTDEEADKLVGPLCGCVEINDSGNRIFCKKPRPSDGELSIYPLPRYSTDLNAAAEMEAGIFDAYDRSKWFRYVTELQNQCCGGNATQHDHVHATARQRVNAFLAVMT